MRRVVTGLTHAGRAVVVSDERLAQTPSMMPGGGRYELWASDASPVAPTDGTQPVAASILPPPGGYRFMIGIFGPETPTRPEDFDVTAGTLAGAEQLFESGEPGMHATDTVDLVFVI